MEIELPNGQIAEFPDDMPHEHIETVLQSHFPMKSSVPSINMPQHEKGFFSNFARGLTQGYPHALKGDINAIAELGGRHPFDQNELEQGSLAQTIGQGFGKIGGHLTAILPAAFATEALIPGLVGASLGAGLAGAATTPGDWKKRLSEGLIEAAIPAGIKGLGEAGKLGYAALKRTPTARKAADVIQQSHEVAYKFATQPLNAAEQEAATVNKPIRLSNKILVAAEDALPNTKANKTLIDNAKKGDYKSVFKLQSDLWKRGNSFTSKQTQAEIDRGHEIFDLRDAVLKGMKTHYDYLGKTNISKNLSEGQNRFREFADMYLSNPTVAKLVGEEKIVPKNLLSKLESDTAYFNKLKNEIPSIGKMLELQQSKKKLKKAIKIGSSLGHGGALTKYLTGSFDNYSSKD
jgi:hypothetical protein